MAVTIANTARTAVAIAVISPDRLSDMAGSVLLRGGGVSARSRWPQGRPRFVRGACPARYRQERVCLRACTVLRRCARSCRAWSRPASPAP
jgi:hypothetical protein